MTERCLKILPLLSSSEQNDAETKETELLHLQRGHVSILNVLLTSGFIAEDRDGSGLDSFTFREDELSRGLVCPQSDLDTSVVTKKTS